ncbi:MAG: DNA-3-methyladenine glycosylase 2 family protein [Clostridia bacterium]|nr:DNA-3-methyladenine glycosylase 2 family protein [Clostridia bacterium]
MPFEVAFDDRGAVITCDIDIAKTLDCGQAFRFSEDGGVWRGVAMGRALSLKQKGNKITLFDVDEDEFNSLWRGYFDLDRDYGMIKSSVSSNEVLKKATDFSDGIHILRQEPWEAVCSFIISANNNIPRIKGIISRLCENFGEQIADGLFTFPSAERISSLSLDDLAAIKSGFRAKYILDAAQKFSRNEIDVEALYTLPVDEARAALMTIKGIGPKVADCALLFGWGRVECFPVDVWIRRAMNHFFGESGLPNEAVEYAGIVQQYLFYWARTTGLKID